MLFDGRQSNGNGSIAVGRCLRDPITLACLFSNDSVIDALSFLISDAAHLRIALQILGKMDCHGSGKSMDHRVFTVNGGPGWTWTSNLAIIRPSAVSISPTVV